jgi:hypothetical protein
MATENWGTFEAKALRCFACEAIEAEAHGRGSMGQRNTNGLKYGVVRTVDDE